MDSFTVNWLKSFGFDKYIELFQEEEIDKSSLLDLTEDMVKELVPKIGQRSKFMSELKKLKVLNNNEKLNSVEVLFAPGKYEDTTIGTNDMSEIDISNAEFLFVNEFDSNVGSQNNNPEIPEVAKIESLGSKTPYETYDKVEVSIKAKLLKLHDGQMVLDYYNSVGSLNESMRNKLCSVIIKDELLQNDNSKKISRSRFIMLAKGIEELFPCETQYTYFIGYAKEGNSVSPNRGKLYDKYCNIKRDINKISLKPKLATVKDIGIGLNEKDFEESLNWLKHNTNPDNQLLQFWKETAPYRLNKERDINCLAKYPGLSKPVGHLLIDIDFEELYPNKGMSLFNKFDFFKQKLKIYVQRNKINLGAQDTFLKNQLMNPRIPGQDDFAAIKIIPLLFQPVNVVIKNGNKNLKPKFWRPSKIEQASAFVISISNANELKTIQSNKVEKAFNYGLTVQPYIVFIGSDEENDTDCFTVVNDIHYKLESPVKALDVCFKSFHTFNLKYPPEAEQIWYLIQNIFFDITGPNKKFFHPHPPCNTLMGSTNYIVSITI